MRRALTVTVAALIIALPAATSFAESEFGPRIPTDYFVTTGAGQSDDGIPPDPYETFSYDLALLEAGIQDFNVVYYTSVIPRDAKPFIAPKWPAAYHGAVLESIMAKAGGVKGDTAVAGVGRVWAEDSEGNLVGGYAAEYEYVYNSQIDPATAELNAKAQLTRSLDHILEIRQLKQQRGTAKAFDIRSLYIEKNYGMAIAVLGFINFDYSDPLPISTD